MNDGRRSEVRRKRASMREVAALADVAISSVSRVLSGHPDVSAEMRDRVIAAVDELEYEPDFLAQSLRRGATLSVGYVVGDISNPLIATITSGAESVLRAAGYSMLLMNSENEAGLDTEHIKFFQARYPESKIERIIVTGGASTIPEFPLYLANKFALNVEIGNAWRNVAFSADRQNELLTISNQFSVAVGLAERNE